MVTALLAQSSHGRHRGLLMRVVQQLSFAPPPTDYRWSRVDFSAHHFCGRRSFRVDGTVWCRCCGAPGEPCRNPRAVCRLSDHTVSDHVERLGADYRAAVISSAVLFTPLTPTRRSWIVVLASLPFVCVELLFPFGRDQGNYAYPAWRWLEGQMPYRDVYVFKPPATLWVHALAIALFGQNMLAVRILDVGWTLATALTVSAIAARWTGRQRIGALAGVLATFLYNDFDFWNTCQTDGWFNLPVALAILLATRVSLGESPRGALIGAGALLGLAVTFKYTAAVLCLPAVGVLWFRSNPLAHPRSLLGDIGRLVVGFVLPLAGTWAWLAYNDAIPGFLDSQTKLVPAYVKQTGRARGIFDVLAVLGYRIRDLEQIRYLFIAGALGVPVLFRGWRADYQRFLPLIWFVAGFLSMLAQNKFFRYHFLSLVPGAAILGAVGIDALLRLARGRQTLALAVITSLMVAPSIYVKRWLAGAEIAFGRLTLEEYWSRTGFDINQMSVKEVLACARRVEALTAPGDHVFIWAFDPIINFLANRPTVSRFLYNYPFSVAWGDPAYEAELLGALTKNPPALIIVGSKDATPHVTGNDADSAMLFQAFTALRNFVEADYGPPETVERYTLYLRKP